MKKLLSITLYGLIALSLVLTVLVFTMPENSGVGVILYFTYVLMALALLSVIVFPLMNVAQNPKAAMKSLAGVGVGIAIVAIAFVFSSAEPITLSDKTVFDAPFSLRITDASLYITYLAMVGAIAVTIYGEIRNSLK